MKEGMKHVNELAHQLAISDVHLSMENARALEHLNSRWKVLQVEFIGRFDAASRNFSCSHPRMCGCKSGCNIWSYKAANAHQWKVKTFHVNKLHHL